MIMNKLVLRQSRDFGFDSSYLGVAFVAQSVGGMDYVGRFTFSAVRNVIGGLVAAALYRDSE